MSPVEALFYAQHYGTPTRICDITISPFCALFFAAEGSSDGAVYVIEKKNEITTASVEMTLFNCVLAQESDEVPVPVNNSIITKPELILSRNYVVQANELNYSNDRAFRQGGTGIVFGYDTADRILKPVGKEAVSRLIIEKIIIPGTSKHEILNILRRLGYSRDILINDPLKGYLFENATLARDEFSISTGYDAGAFKKIIARYRVSTLYFDRDVLSMQIDRLYQSLLKRYGYSSRIWIYFFYDNDDIVACNWICRGVWVQDYRYKIE